jgi:hypothetical protein
MKKKNLLSTVLGGALLATTLIGCSKNEIKVGDVYRFSWNWDEEDPFRKVDVDTVTVLGVKDGYVLYSYKTKKYVNSTEIKFFEKNIKTLGNNE